MIAFDSDVLSLILLGDPQILNRLSQIPPSEQAVPVIVVEEIIRGRLNSIRQAEAGKSKLSVMRAYELFELTLTAFRQIIVLSYTPQADLLFQQWRSRNVRIGSQDLRIAAICVSHSAQLVSRNRRDFDKVPGLTVDYWG